LVFRIVCKGVKATDGRVKERIEKSANRDNRKDLEILNKTCGNFHLSVAVSWYNLGIVWNSLEEYQKAVYFTQKL
jgi:hypothetical protein